MNIDRRLFLGSTAILLTIPQRLHAQISKLPWAQADAILISQRSIHNDSPVFVFRSNYDPDDRTNGRVQIEISDRNGKTYQVPTQLGHGNEFEVPQSSKLAPGYLVAKVQKTTGIDAGRSWEIRLQPYTVVAKGFDISHFFHEDGNHRCWAIGTHANNRKRLAILVSDDYFDTHRVVYSRDIDVQNESGYRSLYIDRFGNIIIGWRPGPLISRDGGKTFRETFSWSQPDAGIMCPFWNITESPDGTVVISEYGENMQDRPHKRTAWSFSHRRDDWRIHDLDDPASFPLPPGGAFNFTTQLRHIHGYHINPYRPNIHMMFIGDYTQAGMSDRFRSPGYYLSQDNGKSWSTDILREWTADRGTFNGPCCVTWFPDGGALIASDCAAATRKWYWITGRDGNWGGPGFEQAIEARAAILPQPGGNQTAELYDNDTTPWMVAGVNGTYEMYGTLQSSTRKNIIWRYDAMKSGPNVQMIAESPVGAFQWLSAGRNNLIPQEAKYFFGSNNRRFARIS